MRASPVTVALLLVSSAAGSQPSSGPASGPTSRPAGPSLQILYTGGGGGLAGYSSTGSAILLLWDELASRGGSAWVERSGTGCFALDGRHLISPEANRGQPVVDFLRGGGVQQRRVLRRDLPLLETDDMLMFQHPENPHLDLLGLMEQRNRRTGEEPSVRRSTGRLTEVTGAQGRKLLLLERKGDPAGALKSDPLAWEPQWVVRGKAGLGDQQGTHYVLLKPWGEGTRRVCLLRSLVAASRSLLVSAGNELSTFERLTGKKSPLRALETRTLASLGYDAIVPGPRELYYGAAELAKSGLPFVATNLFHSKGKRKGKPVFRRYLVKRVGEIRVGIIGLVDRRVVDRAPDPARMADVVARDPVASAIQAIRELRALPGTRPDMIIALSNLRDRELLEAQGQIYGVDLFITQTKRWGRYPLRRSVDTRGRGRERLLGRAPVLLAYAEHLAVGRATARFDGARQLVGLDDAPMAVGPELPWDETLHRRIVGRHLEDLGQMESVLMPSLEDMVGDDRALLEQVREDPEIARFVPREQTKGWGQLWITARLWSVVVANILRRAARAEVALVRRKEYLSATVPGPLTESYVLQWLDDEDTVRLHELSGAQLQDLAKAAGKDATVSGLDRAASRVAGRSLVASERYRVAISSSVAELERVAAVLKGTGAQTRFRLAGDRLEQDASGRLALLREVVMATLRGLRDRHPKLDRPLRETLRQWLRPAGQAIEPRWSIAATGITLSFANFSNHPRSSYLDSPRVRETRTQMPNNYALSVKGELSLAYDDESINWINASRFKLARLMIDLEDIGEGEVENETADDLTVSTELQLKFLKLSTGRGRLDLVPYVNVTFDTEFTATRHILTKERYPHQKELYASAGIVLHPGQILREIRLASLTKTDFVPARGKFEGGLLVGSRLSVPLWRARLDLAATLRYFPDTDDDTLEDLGLILEGEAALVVPFTRDFSVTLGADLYLYRPKLHESEDGAIVEGDTAVSLILSAGLSFDHLWKW